MFDDRGRYPEVLLTPSGPTCLADDPQQIGLADDPAWLFRHRPGVRDAMTEQRWGRPHQPLYSAHDGDRHPG